MARPIKKNAEYFPHYLPGKAMKYIRKKYGNDGYATWFILLEQLTDADDHHIACDEFYMTLLADECGVSVGVLESIIEDLCKIGRFTAELWYQKRVLFCEELRDSIEDAYRKRSNKCIEKEEILHKFGLTDNSTGFPAPETTENEPETTQSKVKESKEEREEETTPPIRSNSYQPANDALASVREMAKHEPIADTQTQLYQVIVDRVLQEPEWWKTVTEFCKLKPLTRQQREDAIKAWAGFIIAKGRLNEIRGFPKAEASLQNWLMRERQYKTNTQ